jgi:secreted trypsin-like serine protease
MTVGRDIAMLVVVSAFASACSERPARSVTAPRTPSFIVDGTPTGAGSFGGVGALLFDFNHDGVLNGDDELCTGSLIAPEVFLTAAHCVVDPSTPPGSQFYVSFAPDLYAGKIKVIKATGYTFDPGYGHDEANLHDEAVIFLPKGSTKGITPYTLPRAGAPDQLAAKGGLTRAIFINVGYGTSASRTGQPSFPYDGKRSMSEAEFSSLQPNWLLLSINTRSTELGGDCFGDSGGPKFLVGDGSTVYATVTGGDAVCRATSKDFRTDTPTARAFLGQFVPLP